MTENEIERIECLEWREGRSRVGPIPGRSRLRAIFHFKEGFVSAMLRYATISRQGKSNCRAFKRSVANQTFLANHYRVIEDIVSESEESNLVSFLDMKFRRKRYEGAHWDSVISGFKESELYEDEMLNEKNETTSIGQIVQRISTFVQRSYAIKDGSSPMMVPHAIDLSEEGYIDPHVDSIKRSGGILAGLSLHSARIMRLKYDTDHSVGNEFVHHLQLPSLAEGEVLDIHLPPRSLYLLEGPLRYTHTHAILGNKSGNGYENKKTERRLSIIFRDEPYNEGKCIEESIQMGISLKGLLK